MGGRQRWMTAVMALVVGMAADGPLAAQPTQLALKRLATIPEHAWAWGSDAGPVISGSKLYVPLGGRGMAIYDVSRPKAPRLVTTVSTALLGGQGAAVAASRTRAYVAIPDQGAVVVLDVSNPAAPRRLAQFASLPDIRKLVLRGRYLFVNAMSSTDYLGGVYVFDVSVNPPAPVGEYLTDLLDPGFFVSDSLIVYLARSPVTGDDFPKLDVIDMSEPGSPRLLGQWQSDYPGNVWNIDLRDGKLFLAAYWGGLWVLDATDPADLSLIARFDWDVPEAIALAVQAAPPYVFVARSAFEGARHYEVYKLTSGALSLVRTLPAELPPDSVYLSDNLLVLKDREGTHIPNARAQVRIFQVFRKQ